METEPVYTNYLTISGLSITREGNGDTLLTGPVVDQAALHGVLKRVRDLGMPLLSINRGEPDEADVPDVKRSHSFD